MSSGSYKSGSVSKMGQGPQHTPTSSSTNHLLDKVNARTSTPDSEALASSDDEVDHRHDAPQPPVQPSKTARRPSWLNDTSSSFARPRKGSFASGSMSPTPSNPSTPSAETAAGPWGPHPTSSGIGRAPGPPAFSWGAGIWNTERKDPPPRLSEVLPSPTSTVPSGAAGNGIFGPDGGLAQTSPTPRDGSNPQIPFAIPLHPTPKTYRSQSYSVGQMEPDVNQSAAAGMSSSAVLGRARHGAPGLQHRPSRPSMLSEMANDGSMLGKVKEVEDDDDDGESPPESLQGSFHHSSESKTIEMLARENAILRQQQYNSRMRPRASTGAPSYFTNGYSLQESVPEESDYAVDELDELNNDGGEWFASRGGRRMSEFGGPQFRSPFAADGRKGDNGNLKRALWSTPGLPSSDASQSRRHSFANMPTRQGSISSVADTSANLDVAPADGQHLDAYLSGYPDPASAAFGGGPGANGSSSYMAPGSHMGHSHNPQSDAFGIPYQPQFGAPPPFPNRAPSPHRSVYGIAPPRHNQLLHIVLFKCARADVFYIQEGTGLTVKPGDLVIVEADRGTDLGTVAKDNVDWQTAKELKEHYAEEHYKWLMMYSQGAAAAQEGSGSGLLASSTSLQGSAVGGMGPPTQHHGQEPNAGELRPKLIKRLAQNHEIQSLRDKEGQEAKAKRVCMQKVKEHGLNMEILDAEFQMDWKKLTFYYFADAYINFNSLVTDLFKIYKTRIWMSAINPASFASPTLGIQAPSGVGPGAVGAGRSSGGNERRQAQQHQEPQQQGFGPGQGGRGFRPPPNPQQLGGDRGVGAPGQGFGGANYGFAQGGGAFGNARSGGPFGQGMPLGMEGFPGSGIPQLGGLPSMRQRFPTPQSGASPNPHAQGMPVMSPQNDWSAAFQGLSLNSG